jgi:phosphotransferase system  glucose/maltose/N-acetylglucosamine-specific IIC component
MRRRNSFFEVLQFPLEVLFFAVILLGIGNLLTSSMFSSFWVIRNPYVLMIAEALMRIGTFLITNFPFLFVIRLVSVKGGGAATNISGLAGYAAFLVMTMFFTKTNLTATAYSSIFGISVASSSVEALSTTTHYPLQTGVIGAIFVSLITVSSYKHSRGRSQYGFFAFIDRDAYCVIRTVFFCCLAGVGTALLWPYLLSGLQQILDFIAADTTNPINLTLYGVLDRFMSVLNLNTLTRQPFWYGADGGTWINNVGGSIAGDVNIWAKQLAAGSLTGMAGRFITPYYVLNLFAVPGMIWAVYSLKTDLIDKRRTRLFFILATCRLAVQRHPAAAGTGPVPAVPAAVPDAPGVHRRPVRRLPGDACLSGLQLFRHQHDHGDAGHADGVPQLPEQPDPAPHPDRRGRCRRGLLLRLLPDDAAVLPPSGCRPVQGRRYGPHGRRHHQGRRRSDQHQDDPFLGGGSDRPGLRSESDGYPASQGAGRLPHHRHQGGLCDQLRRGQHDGPHGHEQVHARFHPPGPLLIRSGKLGNNGLHPSKRLWYSLITL